MSVGESSGGEAKSAADQRTEQLAREKADQAAAKAKELLDKHADLIDPETIARIEQREATSAYVAAQEARAEGRLNDDFSKAPGLTVFFTRAGFEGFSKAVAEGNDERYRYLDGYVAEMQPVDPEETVYSLRLDTGMYAMGFGGATFYGEASTADNQLQRDKPFSAPYNMVVRVEGDSGELWQNAHLTPDGAPRTS